MFTKTAQAMFEYLGMESAGLVVKMQFCIFASEFSFVQHKGGIFVFLTKDDCETSEYTLCKLSASSTPRKLMNRILYEALPVEIQNDVMNITYEQNEYRDKFTSYMAILLQHIIAEHAPYVGDNPIANNVYEFINGYRELVKKTGLTLVSNRKDGYCYLALRENPKRLLGFVVTDTASGDTEYAPYTSNMDDEE